MKKLLDIDTERYRMTIQLADITDVPSSRVKSEKTGRFLAALA